MRVDVPVMIAVALLVGACGRKESDPATADTAAGPGVPTGQSGFDYTCTDGKTFNARIDRGNVLLTIDGQTLTLPADTNASGAHYSGDGTTFIASGREATLIRPGESTRICETK